MSTLKAKISTLIEPATHSPPTVTVGRLAGATDDGAPLVQFVGNATGGPVQARATACYRDVPPGTSVALMFLDGDRLQPLIIGLMADPATTQSVSAERLVIGSEEEIVLRCGHASIVLTRAGKVLINGAYVSSRSTGANRIVGASVQLN